MGINWYQGMLWVIIQLSIVVYSLGYLVSAVLGQPDTVIYSSVAVRLCPCLTVVCLVQSRAAPCLSCSSAVDSRFSTLTTSTTNTLATYCYSTLYGYYSNHVSQSRPQQVLHDLPNQKQKSARLQYVPSPASKHS